MCDGEINNLSYLTSSQWNLYDGFTHFYDPPTAGKLTRQRSLLRFHDNDLNQPRYSDRVYEYDNWGNRSKVKVYTGEGTYGTFASTGLQETRYCYGTGTAPTCTEDVYGAYLGWEYNALGQAVHYYYSDEIGKRYSVPTSLKDANNVLTSATYDLFGRMLTIVRDGEQTVEVSYHVPATPFSNNPFWTEARQKINASQTFVVRKYYNGLGELLQTQVVGANVGGTTQDVVVDSHSGYRVIGSYLAAYSWQTVPYAVATGGYYHARNYLNPGHEKTETVYDALGRAKTVTGTDGTVQATYTYTDEYLDWGLFSLDDPVSKTCVMDALNRTSCSRTDVFGRTRQVSAPVGPEVTYWYDPADHLVDVDYGTAGTTLTYDIAGRKLTMDDPDMGDWSYQYDALGNLTRQSDAKNQHTCLYYDGLNRLKGKNYRSDINCPADPGYPNYTTAYYYDEGGAAAYEIGRRTRMVDASGSTTWDYDARGRMISETKAITGGGTFLTQWGYNSADLVTWMKYPGNNTSGVGEQVNFTYYNQMLLDRVTGTSTYVDDTVYDAAGRVDLRGLGSTTYLQQDYQYYAWTTQGGRLSGIDSGRVTYPPASLQDLSYSYDAVGNITDIVDSLNSQTQEFDYDSLNRLVSASATGTEQQGGYSESYTYSSSTGNLASKANVSYKYAEVAYGGVLPAHGVRRAYQSGGTSKTVTIRAKGTICDGGYPEMELYVNGVYQEDWIVTSAYADYNKTVTLSGADIIEVVFTNDCYVNGEDRNLYVDYIVVDGQTIQAEGGAGVIDKGGGSAAFDDVNVVVGQENIAWNGSLRIAVGQGAFAGGYDANGNMTVRVVNGKGQVLSYDVENRLVEVQDSLNTDAFSYDGDGKRVKADVGNGITYYMGDYFEWTGSTSTMVKYYYAGGSRVAMRIGSSTMYYLLADHLGGTNVTVSTAGVEYGEVRYRAFGETRYSSGTTPTTYRFTGQREEASIGLYYYGARWYDSALGRFAQADTIVPNPGDPVAWDRYAYVRNNPVVNIDPSGHRTCTADEAATGDETCEQNYPLEDIDYIIHRVLMGIFKLVEPRPELDIETVPGVPTGWLDILIRGVNVVANIFNSFAKQDLEPDVFVWLTYTEYDDGTVSIPGLTINNNSDQAVYLNWVKFTTYNKEDIFRPSTMGFDGDYLATISPGVSGWVPFYQGVPTPTISPPPTYAWFLTVTVSSNFMVNVNHYWAYPSLQYTIFPRY